GVDADAIDAVPGHAGKVIRHAAPIRVVCPGGRGPEGPVGDPADVEPAAADRQELAPGLRALRLASASAWAMILLGSRTPGLDDAHSPVGACSRLRRWYGDDPPPTASASSSDAS